MAGYIPKEQLQAYTRWEADSFDPRPPPVQQPSAPPPPPPPSVTVEEMPAIKLPTAEDIERIHQQAQAEGYQAGHAEGYAAGLAGAAPQVERLAELARGLQQALQAVDQEIAESLLAFGLALAQQLTKVTLQVQPETLLPIIREALAALPLHHGPVTLLINPADAPLVNEHLGDQFGHAGWHILEDAEIAPGGCKVRAGASEVDASQETRWRRTLEAIGVSQDWLDAQP